MARQYGKAFIPLESNPEVFTELIHKLGVSQSLAFHDILSLDDPELLSFVPRPALALVLVFPTTFGYEKKLEEQDRDTPEYTKAGDDEDVIWYRQTINNACGLYAILHAISNGIARDLLVPGSHISKLLEKVGPQKATDRAFTLENDQELEDAYKVVALQGDSEVPASAEDEVDFHYVCFTKSHKDGQLYELNGDRKGPVSWGPMEGDDTLSEDVRKIVKDYMGKAGEGIGFSLLALAPA
ncbi:Fc.00g094880.m01.CDS01 [Cosmosporella sp. VM-42]